MRVGAVILAVVVAGVLAGAALAHATLPHSHAESPIVVDLFHAAAHPGTAFGYTLVVGAALLLLVAPLRNMRLAHAVAAYALRARERDAYLASLRRGIESHRRFG